jgi:hypothetical protein
MSHKYFASEIEGIRNARKANPEMPQRELARKLHAGFNSAFGRAVSVRKLPSIYAAVRRLDAGKTPTIAA